MDANNNSAAPQAPDQHVSPLEFITTAAGSDLVMAGPLAQAYSQGLNELYAKETTDKGVSLETQAVDMGITKRGFLINTRPLLDAQGRANMGIFYGVMANDVRVRHLVDIVDTLIKMSDETRKKSVVVIDSKIVQRPGQTPEFVFNEPVDSEQIRHNAPVRGALEAYCASKGVKVYASLEEFVNAQKTL